MNLVKSINLSQILTKTCKIEKHILSNTKNCKLSSESNASYTFDNAKKKKFSGITMAKA